MLDSIKLKIISIPLAATILLTSAGCSLNKNSEYDNQVIQSYYSLNLDNIDDSFLKNTLDDYVEKVSNIDSFFQFDWDSFFSKLQNTQFVKICNDVFSGSYNISEGIFCYTENDIETIRHEIGHMLLQNFKNESIDEGLNQLLLHDVFGYEIKDDVFDASLCKIYCKILSDNELSSFLSGNIEVLKHKLASIVPAYSDAQDFLDYTNNACYLYRKYNNSFFEGTHEEFFNSSKFDDLKSYRTCCKERIKIYLRAYYDNIELTDQSPIERLTEMYEILNIVTYDMHDNDVEGEIVKDNFLADQINKLCTYYDISQKEKVEADNIAMNYKNSNYIIKKTNQNVK